MDSLKDVYFAMVDQDHVKVAQAQAVEQYGQDFSGVDPALLKQASDYDAIGRKMATDAFSDMVKEAMDEAMPYASKEEKKKEADKVIAKAKGEKSDDDDDDDYDDKGEESEKKAQVKIAVLRQMQQDPEYVAQLLSKYNIG